MDALILRLQELEKRYDEISQFLSRSDASQNSIQFQKLLKEHADLQPIVDQGRKYQGLIQELSRTHELLVHAESDFKELAQEELATLEEKKQHLERELKARMIPQPMEFQKNAIIEIRAGTGGQEAALFAADLFRMYSRWIEKQRWKLEVMSHSPAELGGMKEIIFSVIGKGAYGRLRFESGTHRVQRIPQTETQGRVHTSAATVAVLPEVEAVEIEIKETDLRVDTFCASGPGGQGVNTTYSAVRITHLPTGVVVQCQDERSQLKNRETAMKVLYARLKEKMEQDQNSRISEKRKNQIGSGDRSEKIRTYNFPQNRLTDHRIGLTLYQLDKIVNGNLDLVIQALEMEDQKLRWNQTELE
jgi:peptide chain release factor 1